VDDQLLGLLVQRWPTRPAVRAGQAPATSRRCQPSSVSCFLKKHDQRDLGRTRLTAAGSGRSVGSSLSRGIWWRDGELVAEHQDLKVLGGVTAGHQPEQLDGGGTA